MIGLAAEQDTAGRVIAYVGLVLIVVGLAVFWPQRNHPHVQPDRRWRPTVGAWLLRRRRP